VRRTATRVGLPPLLSLFPCWVRWGAVVVPVPVPVLVLVLVEKKAQKKKTEKGTTVGKGTNALGRTGVERTAVGARVGNRRLRCWIARRASKTRAPTFADAPQEQPRRAMTNEMPKLRKNY
jgi:hypothetical protein